MFEFDQGKQDFLPGLPFFEDFPQIIGFGKSKDNYFLYQSELSINSFLNFIDQVTNGTISLVGSQIQSFQQDLIKTTEAVRRLGQDLHVEL